MEGAEIELRDVTEEDLPVLFEHQHDPEAARMADFPSRDLDTFMAHWAGILTDESVVKKAVLVGGRLAGNVVCFDHGDRREVGYWVGREFWGRGVGTAALTAFLRQVGERPLYAHVAKRNRASVRVLEKSGFTLVGEEDDGLLLKLDDA